MFRFTLTLLTTFLLLNDLKLAATRSFDVLKHDERQLQKRKAAETEKSQEVHSRQKRSWGSAFRALAAGSFAVSIGATIYTEITRCKHFKPSSCKPYECKYYDECPNVCQTPDKNNALIESEKETVANVLDDMDDTQVNVLNLALDAGSASISNEIILQQIDEINDKVDRIMFALVQLDRNISTQFAAQSKEIESALRDERFSLDEVVNHQMVGIFDKFTWEGTGLFVLSIAAPIGFFGVQYLRNRFAINKLYKEMRADLIKHLTGHLQGNGVPKRVQRDYWIHQVDSPQVKADLKKSAKSLHYSRQAQKQPGKWATRIEAASSLFISALSIYTTWAAINRCQTLANDLKDSAGKVIEQHDEILKVKDTEIDPLWIGVQKEAWQPVKDFMTNETTVTWLTEIRNLTLGAEHVNTTTANTIQHFINNIDAADAKATLSLQNQLIGALKSIKYKYDCLGDKMHAIGIVLRDCESGRDTFENLYDEVANQKNELNRDDCVNDDMVPFTSINEFKKIVDAWAEHEGWHSNCLLNSEDLLFRVCTEYLQGYTNPSDIVTQVNNTHLTVDMVENFLSRCPEPEITPKAIETICKLYCLNEPVADIAITVALKESQVESVILTCAICEVDESVVREICAGYYCQSKNVTEIAEEVRIPIATVEYVVANNCSNQCSVSQETKDQVITLACSLNLTADQIYENNLVDLPLEIIQSIIDEADC